MTTSGSAPLVPSWLDELRLEPGPPFATMGIHSLDVDGWLDVDDLRDAQLAYKATLLATVPDIVVATQPGSEAPAAELLELVRSSLATLDVEVAPAAGDSHPLVEAARLVQEDLAVLERDEHAWNLTAGVVCFPTHWTIGDKIGLPLEAIHAPVAHYERELRERVDRFFDRLTPDRPVWRRNWFVVPTNELHLTGWAPQMHSDEAIAEDGSPMWIRSERQTLRRLPGSDAIVFTIRVQQAPLGVVRERRDLAARMLVAIQSWDREKRIYTSTGGALVQLVEWLESLTNHS